MYADETAGDSLLLSRASDVEARVGPVATTHAMADFEHFEVVECAVCCSAVPSVVLIALVEVLLVMYFLHPISASTICF